jgi:hypothetical protein
MKAAGLTRALTALRPSCYNRKYAVGVAQLAEHRTVAPDVAGSIPVSHPRISPLERPRAPTVLRKNLRRALHRFRIREWPISAAFPEVRKNDHARDRGVGTPQ